MLSCQNQVGFCSDYRFSLIIKYDSNMIAMSVDKRKGPIFDPGLCRCCGSMKRCRVLNVEYQCMGQKEVYADMIIDCFGIMLSHLDAKPSSRLVCATCVTRLREAVAFRAQVLRCEAAFLQLRMIDGEAEENQARLEASAKLEVEVKTEPTEDGSVGSPAPDDLDPDNLTSPPDDPNEMDQSTAVKAELDSDDAPLRPRKRRLRSPRSPRGARSQRAHNGTPRPPPTPSDEEPRMCAEELAELRKHRANIKTLLEFSNATPIRCYSGVGYRCCYCRETCPVPKDLKTHTLIKHDVKMRRRLMQRNQLSAFLVRLDITGLKCLLCHSNIDSIEELLKHLSTKHEKKLHIDIKSHLLPFKFEDGLKCVLCAKVFTKFKSLQEHMNMHFRNYICDVCDTGYPTKRMLGQHFNMHKTGVFHCEYCPKSFNTDQKKKLHERHTHVSGSSNFLNKCAFCQQRFKSYRVKEQHMLESHGVSSAVKCQACEKSFKNQRQLSIHVQRDHLMRRPHTCPECDMSFFERQQLRNHLVKHTGLREFRCEVCLKAYGRKKTLREHMRIHEAHRRFKCQFCGLGFVQKCSWRGHMRSKHSEIFAE